MMLDVRLEVTRGDVGNHAVCGVLETLGRWHHGSVFVLLEVQLQVIPDVHQILELGQ